MVIIRDISGHHLNKCQFPLDVVMKFIACGIVFCKLQICVKNKMWKHDDIKKLTVSSVKNDCANIMD